MLYINDARRKDKHLMATETQGLTVEAWVDFDEDRAEAVQTAVAQWSFADSMDRIATYDAGSTG